MTRPLQACALLLAATALARAQLLPIRAYNASNGLAEDRVNAIMEDTRGFVWFATNGGLSRFDGYRFLTWGVRPAVSYRGSFAFLADSGGDFWVGTAKGARHFREGGPEHNDLLTPSGPTPWITGLLRTRSGRVIAGNNGALYEIVNGKSIRRLAFPEPLRSGVGIGAIAEDLTGHIWLAIPPDGLMFYDPSQAGGKPLQTIALPKGVTNVNDMVEAPAGYMWVGSNLGLLRYQREPGQTPWRFTGIFGLKEGLVGTEVTSLLRKADGAIWIGTFAGISLFAERDADHPRFRNIGRENGLTDKRVTTLAEDRAGNVWAGTETAGVMLIKTLGFTTYQEADGLKGAPLHQVLEDRQGTLLAIGTSDSLSRRTLAYFDGERFHQTDGTLFGPAPPWSWQRFLIQTASGEWWASTANGLCRYRASPASALAREQPEACYAPDRVYHLFEDSHGNIWASAANNHLLRWNRESGRVRYFSREGAEFAEPQDTGQLISAMAEDRQGNVWLGAWNGGVSRYADGRIQHFGDSSGAPRAAVSTMLCDSAGRLWIGTAAGLTVVDEPGAQSPRFHSYSKTEVLKDTGVTSVVEDRFGSIWAGTVRGVVNLDPRSGGARLFTVEDGLPAASFPSAIRDHNGALWFATSSGLARIVPREQAAVPPPPVVFTGIRIADEDYVVSPVGAEHPPQAILGPEKDHVEIEFASPGAEAAGNLRYQFLLDGADSAWSGPRAENRVDYRHLKSGAYRFRVRSVDRNGVQGVSAAEFDFRILPPVWLRWWFELPAMLMAIGAAYWLHSYRVAHILAMEHMRTNIAADLHDDIGASLTRIAVLSEVARLHVTSNPEQADAPLRRIGGTARELLDSLNDIVWSIGSHEAGIDSLVGRMREFALDVLGPGGVEFTLNCDDALRGKQMAIDVRRHVLLIFKECIHNAARHSGCRSVRACLALSDGNLMLTVSDDGRGLPPGTPARGNGLPGMKRRTQIMRGRIEIDGNAGSGCRVSLLVPLTSGLLGRRGAA